jgi:hypothetical protein
MFQIDQVAKANAQAMGKSTRKQPYRNNVCVEETEGQILLGANILTPASDVNIHEHIFRA